MKLTNLELSNFKGISNLNMQLDGKSTILFGTNGAGKSTILRAIDLLYANIIWKLTKSKKLAELEDTDISYGKSVAVIHGNFEFADGFCADYLRSVSRKDGRRHNAAKLKNITDAFQERYLTVGYEDEAGNWIELEDKKNMPVFVNYGVNRLVIDVPVRASNKVQFKKLNAFDKAIESKIDFKQLFEWFRIQEDIENQKKVRQYAEYEDRGLAAVKKAMLAMLDGFEDIRIERKPLGMKVTKEGKSLDIQQLSDGEKCTIALFGDLARRMTIANPGLKNPLEGTGVVLIDELDLHMHTSWQRKVVRILKQTFPNIQFIITTHSPQILSEIDEEYNLFIIKKEGDATVCQRFKSFMGWDVNVILEEVMDTASVNEAVKEKLAALYECISSQKYDRAEEIADDLEAVSAGRIDGVTKARMLIARGRKRAKDNKGDNTGLV